VKKAKVRNGINLHRELLSIPYLCLEIVAHTWFLSCAIEEAAQAIIKQKSNLEGFFDLALIIWLFVATHLQQPPSFYVCS